MKIPYRNGKLHRSGAGADESSASARDWIDADLWLRRSPGLRLIFSTLWLASIPCAAIILIARIAGWVFG